MFRFWGSSQTSPGDIAKVTKEVDQDDLIVPLRMLQVNWKKRLWYHVQASGGGVEEQLSFLGPKRLTEIESAQDRVVSVS